MSQSLVLADSSASAGAAQIDNIPNFFEDMGSISELSCPPVSRSQLCTSPTTIKCTICLLPGCPISHSPIMPVHLSSVSVPGTEELLAMVI